MTKLDRALHRLARLSPERQAEIVDILSDLVEMPPGEAGASTWQVEELKRRIAEPEDFAPDEEVEALLSGRDV